MNIQTQFESNSKLSMLELMIMLLKKMFKDVKEETSAIEKKLKKMNIWATC